MLTQLDLDLGNGRGQGYTLRADDIFACQWNSGVTGVSIPDGAKMKRASFRITVEGFSKPLDVQIRPPNTLRLARHSSADLVHNWAAARGFKGGKPTKAKPIEESSGKLVAIP